MERIPAKPSHTGRATRSSLIRGVQHQHLVRSDWWLLPRWKHARHRALPSRGNTLTWTATVNDPDVLLEPWTTTPRVALLNPRPNALLPESLPCSERDLGHVVTKEHH